MRTFRSLGVAAFVVSSLALEGASAHAQVHAWTGAYPNGNGSVALLALGASGESYVLTNDSCWSGSGMRLGRFDASGQVEWTATFSAGGGWSTIPVAVEVDPSGAILVGGYTQLVSPRELVVVSYAPNGTEMWTRKFPGATVVNEDTAMVDLEVDAAGRVYVAGSVEWPLVETDITTLAYAADGAPLWNQHIGTGLFKVDYAGPLVPDDAGGVIVSGAYTLGSGQGYRIMLAKYDASGATSWLVHYPNTPPGTSDNYTPYDLVRTGQGELYLLGGRNTDLLLLKFDASGALLWSREYGDPGRKAFGRALALDAAGRVAIVASTYTSVLNFDHDYLTLQYDPDGTLRWAKRYDNPSGLADFAEGISIDALGRVVVTGTSIFEPAVGSFSTVAYDEHGELQWTRRYPNGPTPAAKGLRVALGADGVLRVAGTAGVDCVGSFAVLAAYAPSGFQRVGTGTLGTGGATPQLDGLGDPQVGTSCTVQVTNGLGGASAVLGYGLGYASHVELPLFGGLLYVAPTTVQGLALGPSGTGLVVISLPPDPALIGVEARFQAGVLDGGAAGGVALTNALEMWIG